jgi:uncharacterized protein
VIICDTGPLVATLNKADHRHAECRDILEEHHGPLVIPALVVLEVCQLLDSRAGPVAESAFLKSLHQEEFDVEPLTIQDYGRMSELTRKYSDLPLGAADACVIAVAERLNVTELITLD